MLLIESHCWNEWDEWERREEEIDFEDWEEKWLFWERLSVLFMKREWVDMDGCCWGDGLVMICMIDIDESSVFLCFHPQWERENVRERLKETHTHCVIQLTPKTVEEISSNEGREWGFDWTHAETSWRYGCGQSGLREGRCSWLVILVRNSVTFENDSSE